MSRSAKGPDQGRFTDVGRPPLGQTSFRLPLLLLPCLLFLSSLLSGPLSAQEEISWALPTTIGYGGAGTAVGYFVGQLAVQEATQEGRWTVLETPSAVGSAILGAWFGGRLGLSMGLEADSLLAHNTALKPGHRRGVQLGTVLAGAALASGMGVLHAATLEEGKTHVVATFALTGATLGALVQVLVNDHLHPPGPAMESRVSVSPGGRISVGVQLPFRGVAPEMRS